MSEGSESFYADLDQSKDAGRGSCCTWWSFLVLFATLLVLGLIALAALL